MKYCSKCQMKVQNQLNNCPLCGQSLESVEFEIEHDSSLIGGFVLKVDDFEYDYSVSGMLKRLKSNIIK